MPAHMWDLDTMVKASETVGLSLRHATMLCVLDRRRCLWNSFLFFLLVSRRFLQRWRMYELYRGVAEVKQQTEIKTED